MEQIINQISTLSLDTNICSVCLSSSHTQINTQQWFRSKKIAHLLTRRNTRPVLQCITLLPIATSFYQSNVPMNQLPERFLAKLLYESFTNNEPFTWVADHGGVFFKEVSEQMFGPIKVRGNIGVNGSICVQHSCPTCTGIKSHRRPNCWKCKKHSVLGGMVIDA